jgi:uncharacterized protein (TIGR04255 family)
VSDEVYPRAPLQYVIFEIQYPVSPALAKPEGKELVYDRLAEEFPLLETLNSVQIQFSVGEGAGPPMSLPQPGSQELRMTNRHRTTSITVGSATTRIEQAAYVKFANLRQLIVEVLQAVSDAARIRGMQRATLRYIDEIQHPNVASPGDWAGLVHPNLIGPLDLLAAPTVVTEGVVMFQPDPQHIVRLVYGAQPAGSFAVDPNGPLRVRPRSSGPFFKLDTESTWLAPADEVPPLVVAEVVELADRLHDPVSDVFEASLTEELRNFIRTPA